MYMFKERENWAHINRLNFCN